MADAMQLDPASIEEALRQRGLLATGGNIRLSPFVSPTVAASTSPTSLGAGNGSATANALSANGGGGITVADANGQPVVIDPAATELPANIPDESLVGILPYLAGAAGAAGLAALIRRHLKNRGITMPDDPLAPNVPDTIGTKGDGERVVVDGGELVPENGAAVDPTKSRPKRFPNTQSEVKQLTGPKSLVEDKGTKPKYLTSSELAKRRAGARNAGVVGAEGSGPTIAQADAYSDISPEEMKQARTIADALIDQRMKGNMRRAKGQGIGRKGYPTGSMDEQGILNNVIRMIRQGKIKPNQVMQAIP